MLDSKGFDHSLLAMPSWDFTPWCFVTDVVPEADAVAEAESVPVITAMDSIFDVGSSPLGKPPSDVHPGLSPTDSSFHLKEVSPVQATDSECQLENKLKASEDAVEKSLEVFVGLGPVDSVRSVSDSSPQSSYEENSAPEEPGVDQPENTTSEESTCYPMELKHFTAVLRKKPERGDRFTRLGLQLAKREAGLVIVAFASPGELALNWNKKHAKHRLQQGDVITAVNGIGAADGADAMLSQIDSADKLNLSVTRVLQYALRFHKNSKVGLDVSRVDGTVVGLHPGLIHEYNSKKSTTWMVAHGDVLLEVSGHANTPEEMMHQIQATSGMITLKFRRLRL